MVEQSKIIEEFKKHGGILKTSELNALGLSSLKSSEKRVWERNNLNQTNEVEAVLNQQKQGIVIHLLK